jgi:hypothetical protein
LIAPILIQYRFFADRFFFDRFFFDRLFANRIFCRSSLYRSFCDPMVAVDGALLGVLQLVFKQLSQASGRNFYPLNRTKPHFKNGELP